MSVIMCSPQFPIARFSTVSVATVDRLLTMSEETVQWSHFVLSLVTRV